MKQNMQTFIRLLTSGAELTNTAVSTSDHVDPLLEHYLASSEPENIAQLAFLYQQGQKSAVKFGFYQAIVTKLIKGKGLPLALIALLTSSDLLSFFTPALQLAGNFNKTNAQQRNVLHYLLAGSSTQIHAIEPPCNYLRSMMLFESNEALCNGLCQRDNENLTPVELYLCVNKNLKALSNHELSALFALIEIEQKQQSTNHDNYVKVIKGVAAIFRAQAQVANRELQRVLVIATYYHKSINEVLGDIA
ncbi:hypothetical protein KO495_05105 [Colwellia sp. D2M02]|uniref:hypothetical protein n=1 Tax=Colwellia sp. D2M02 TaxID=2841562 RepID=UPI001C085C43|nr:hypothetical protein [Colwellia sp. D2M02]MBU2892698.1 hypothetical protein [Colwellia sp. D2M02]